MGMQQSMEGLNETEKRLRSTAIGYQAEVAMDPESISAGFCNFFGPGVENL